MTEHDDRDELLSAHLDGATTGEEAARIAADPELMARLAALRDAAALVAAPVEPASDDERDAAIAAAVATARGVAPVIDLDARRRRRVRLQLVSAAAAIAVLAVAAIGLVNRDESNRATSTALAVTTTAGERVASAATGQADAGAGAAFSASPRDLGSFTDTGSLAAAARGALAASKSSGGTTEADTQAGGATTTTAPGAPGAVAPLAACDPDLEGGVVLLDAAATLDGAPVRVLVVQLADSSEQLIVLDARCAVLDRQAL